MDSSINVDRVNYSILTHFFSFLFFSFLVQKPSGIGYGNTVSIDFCSSCSYRYLYIYIFSYNQNLQVMDLWLMFIEENKREWFNISLRVEKVRKITVMITV